MKFRRFNYSVKIYCVKICLVGLAEHVEEEIYRLLFQASHPIHHNQIHHKPLGHHLLIQRLNHGTTGTTQCHTLINLDRIQVPPCLVKLTKTIYSIPLHWIPMGTVPMGTVEDKRVEDGGHGADVKKIL